MACSREPDPTFMQRLEQLKQAKTDPEVTTAIANVVRYAREHDVDYGYVMRIRGTNEVVKRGELEHHLNDDIVVTILVGSREPFTEVEWDPPANWYITRLVMP